MTLTAAPSGSSSLLVSWQGSDPAPSSGIQGYDVQYKVGDGPAWTPWLTNASQTQATFQATLVQTYTFQARVIDNAGNQSNWVQTGLVEAGAVTKYYLFGETRVAMRQGGEVYYLHGDHLGSVSLTTDSSGNKFSEASYLPYGQERWSEGASPTDFGFTSQRNEAGFGLIDYNARYYDPFLGRFISPDTIVSEPGNPQSWNRYSYVENNPLKFIDPTGHCGGPREDVDGTNDSMDQVCVGGGGPSGGNPGGSRGGPGRGASSVGQGGAGSSRGGGGSGNQGSVVNSVDEIDDLVKQAQNAQKQAASLHQTHKVGGKTVAVSADGQQTLSGWNHKNPNFTQVDVNDVFARGETLNHIFKPHGRDMGISGRYHASHAEKQMSILTPNKPVGIAGQNMCPNCQNYYQKLAVDTGRVQVVADPRVTRIFHPDGRTTLVFPDKKIIK